MADGQALLRKRGQAGSGSPLSSYHRILSSVLRTVPLTPSSSHRPGIRLEVHTVINQLEQTPPRSRARFLLSVHSLVILKRTVVLSVSIFPSRPYNCHSLSTVHSTQRHQPLWKIAITFIQLIHTPQIVNTFHLMTPLYSFGWGVFLPLLVSLSAHAHRK